MRILGISCFYHDSAAALIENGNIIAASQEERFTRIKHDPAFPSNAISSCLEVGNLNARDIDAVVFYEKPFLKFERLLETYLAFAPKGLKSFAKAIPLWSSEKIFQKRLLCEHLQSIGFDKDITNKIYFSDHHLSHAASSFYCSPFDKSLVLVMDGVGEWASTSLFLANYDGVHIQNSTGNIIKTDKENTQLNNAYSVIEATQNYSNAYSVSGVVQNYSNAYSVSGVVQNSSNENSSKDKLNSKYGIFTNLKMVKEIPFPHSLGLLYSAVTYHLGFKVNSGEYKIMGLAPYGRPRFKDKIENNLIKYFPDGSYWLDQKYFDYCAGLTMTNSAFTKAIGLERREPESQLNQDHMDLAASIQVVLENAILNLLKPLVKEYPDYTNLCLSGGVALNCVANGNVLRRNLFKDIFIQPAAGDAGGALGAALAFHHLHTSDSINQSSSARNHKTYLYSCDIRGSYLGPSFKSHKIIEQLNNAKAIYKEHSIDEVILLTAKAISEGKAVGWFQGAMEFGPRALGNRSILGDPRDKETQKKLNLKIKFRESFRPFAPAVLEEFVTDWFEIDRTSPYMLLVAQVAKKYQISLTESQKLLFGLDLLNIPKSNVPAITHVDYSARIQTVSKKTNPKFHKLITAFKDLTGVPLIVNTSFNVRGEPIVCTPQDAFKCFMGTDLDLLIIENFVLWKDKQSVQSDNYHQSFSLD